MKRKGHARHQGHPEVAPLVGAWLETEMFSATDEYKDGRAPRGHVA